MLVNCIRTKSINQSSTCFYKVLNKSLTIVQTTQLKTVVKPVSLTDNKTAMLLICQHLQLKLDIKYLQLEDEQKQLKMKRQV